MTEEQAERVIRLLRAIDRGVTWVAVHLLLVLVATGAVVLRVWQARA